MRTRPSEEDTLIAWDRLKRAVEAVECALPSQMTEAVADLVSEKLAFENLMLGRGAS